MGITALTKNHILSDYDYLKKKAQLCHTNAQYEASLSYIKAAANIAYHLNFIYADEELETLLISISSKLIEIKSDEICNEDKFVFYDFFGLDNRCLTQQYLRALISWNSKFLYIVENYNHTASVAILKNYKAMVTARF